MYGFTPLEREVLLSIFSETPNLIAILTEQLEQATVLKRWNSGAGFFTSIAVAPTTHQVIGPSVLGNETGARVKGLEHGMGFVLFLKEGKLTTLEGHTFESFDTRELDLSNVEFEVRKHDWWVNRRPDPKPSL